MLFNIKINLQSFSKPHILLEMVVIFILGTQAFTEIPNKVPEVEGG